MSCDFAGGFEESTWHSVWKGENASRNQLNNWFYRKSSDLVLTSIRQAQFSSVKLQVKFNSEKHSKVSKAKFFDLNNNDAIHIEMLSRSHHRWMKTLKNPFADSIVDLWYANKFSKDFSFWSASTYFHELFTGEKKHSTENIATMEWSKQKYSFKFEMIEKFQSFSFFIFFLALAMLVFFEI